MGYSSNPDSITRVRRFLLKLKETKDDTVIWQTPDPKKFQYYLHSGLKAAELLQDPEFLTLKGTWKIKIKGSTVVASRKVISEPYAAIEVGKATEFYELISELTTNPVSSIFNLTLSDEELGKFSRWCSTKDATFTYKEGVLSVIFGTLGS